jgi:hypothetical protein
MPNGKFSNRCCPARNRAADIAFIRCEKLSTRSDIYCEPVGAWRLLPHDFPHWRAVYQYFKIWKQDGTWLKIHDYLHKELRGRMRRDKQPSAAIVDSQSVKTTEKGGRKEVTMEARK